MRINSPNYWQKDHHNWLGGHSAQPYLFASVFLLWCAICLFNLYKVHEHGSGNLIDNSAINMIDYKLYCRLTFFWETFVISLLIGSITTFVTRDLDQIWQLGRPTSNEMSGMDMVIYETARGRYKPFYL